MHASFHPVVQRWFAARFGAPTEPQALAWPLIAAGKDVLVSAPTGSGKTLAAFLSAIDGLLRAAIAGRLPDETRVLYVSPLRALSNDVERNLTGPLAELRAEAGGALPEVRAAVRTGDTPASRRQALLRRPPHLLVTTPESLYLLLTSGSGRAALAGVETVIVDEIHALARDKRGAHLALSLERLEALARRRPQRLGLSATVHPLDEVARFLVGAARVGPGGRPRCELVETGRRRTLDLGIEIPEDALSSIAAKELWAETYDRVAELALAHRSTLVFVNTRRLAERAAHALSERLGAGAVEAHHGSLARDRRLRAEARLKSGEARVVVATASLELGIDVGAVDLVVHLGSPGSLSAGLQRIGRAGHALDRVPRARLFPMTRDELVECAALVRGLRRGVLEPTVPRAWPRDVLAQQVVAEASAGAIHEDRLFALVTRAWPYRDLPRAEFDAVVTMLAEGVAGRTGRATALLHRDGVNRRVVGRRGARITALTNAGTIPETGQYAVVAEPEGITVGQLDEDFAIESLAGDVFLLGNASWRIRRVESGVVRVEDARGAPPNVPFWNGEAPGRSGALSAEVSALREELEARLGDPAAAIAWLCAEGAMPEPAARQVVEYLAASRALLGAIPTQHTLVAERFFDEAGGMQLVVHAPFGARQNRAYGMALRKRFCRTFDFELQAAASDDGVLLSLGPQHAFPLETIFEFLAEASLPEVLEQAAIQAPVFQVRWRWNAARALALPRMRGGRKVPPAFQRMRGDDLLAAVFPAQVACQDNAPGGPIEPPDHPLVKETLRDCLEEAMDAPALLELVRRIRGGALRLVAVDTPEPSPLAHELLGARPWAYLDDAPLEERRARAVAVRRALPRVEAEREGGLDPDAIAAVEAQVAPDVRDAEEAHDLLLELGLLPDAEAAPLAGHLEALLRDRRALRVTAGGRTFWRAAERGPLAEVDDAAEEVLRGWVGRLGPFTEGDLAARLGLSPARVAAACLALEGEGRLLRGRFRPGRGAPGDGAPEWCERTVLSRIHRLTLDRLRKEIEPVTTADLLRFLLRWQHLAPGTRLHGAHGLAEVIGQLQGFHAPACAWEPELLAARVSGDVPALLDQLCLGGQVAWGRLAAPGPLRADGEPARRVSPRAAPVTLALREDLGLLLAAGPAEPLADGPARRVRAALEARGASFLGELAAATGLAPAEAEAAAWELARAGHATCDAFAGLRAALAAGARRGPRRPGPGSGRWSLLERPEAAGAAEAPERLLALAQLYLRRYGVVFRDLLAREEAPPWRELARAYRTLEARGSVRGGRFVAAFTGEQFALPEAVDALRAVRRAPRDGKERVEVAAADPLNLVGLLTPGPRIPAVPGRRVVFVDGVPGAEERAPAAARVG